MKKKAKGKIMFLLAITLLATSCGNVNTKEGTKEVEIAKLSIDKKYQQNDLILFTNEVLGGWSMEGGQELDERGFLPVDKNMTYNSLPSLHIKTSINENQWLCSIVPKGWNAMNLEPYVANGTLEFNIKGAKGGEVFELSFGGKRTDGKGDIDIVSFRTDTQFEITKEWQHISIPLKDVMNLSGEADLRSFRQLIFKEVDNGVTERPVEVWINDVRIITSDDETSQNPVKVNQVEYHLNADKYALISGFAHKFTTPVGTIFRVKDTKDKVIYTGKLSLICDDDSVVSGDRILKADFSDIKVPGTYFLEVEGVGKSQKFTIGDNIYKPLLEDITKYYYLQRGNEIIEEKYVGKLFARGEGLPQDRSVPLNSQRESSKRYDVSGGWYDAGDYGKYTNAGATAVTELLWAYEMFPNQFRDKKDFIPESGNGVSDLLDEIRWELDFLLKMQDKDTGGVYSHVWAQNYDGTPDIALTMDRYIQDKNGTMTNVKPTTHTADVVAALAHGYTVFKNIDKEYAEKLLKAAKFGYQYLEKNSNLIISMPNEPYYDGNDTDNRLWAAAELYRATGEKKYDEYFLNNYRNFEESFEAEKNGHGWGNMEKVAFYAYLSSKNPASEVKEWFKEKFTSWSDDVFEKTVNNPWKTVLGENDYVWGSNSVIGTTLMDLYVGNKVLGKDNDRTIAMMRTNMNYFLGVNPLAFSYVSGYGENCLSHTYSNIYNYDGILEIPKGYFAGGPNQFQGAELSKFNARDYVDSGYEWTTNEHTIYWNSVLIFSTAALNENLQEVSIMNFEVK